VSTTSDYSQTPPIVRFAVWLTLFNTWVLFEETVVDRYGLWEYMPYYRVARLCSWDIGAIIVLALFVRWVFRARRPTDDALRQS
jgi:hypothetical protein